MSLEKIVIKRKYFMLILPVLVAMSVWVTNTGYPLSWLSTILFGCINLGCVFGFKIFAVLLKPMNKPYFKTIVKSVLMSLLIQLCCLLISEKLGYLSISYLRDIRSDSEWIIGLSYFEKILLLGAHITSIIGEEFLVASIAIPLFIYMKKTKMAWIVSNLISCAVFGCMHILAYETFNPFLLLSLGLSHYPIMSTWKKTESIRGGIYAHLLRDLPILMFDIF